VPDFLKCGSSGAYLLGLSSKYATRQVALRPDRCDAAVLVWPPDSAAKLKQSQAAVNVQLR